MYELIASNKRRSILLIAGFVGVLTLVGMAFGLLVGYGWQGTVFALVFSGGLAFASYWKADAVALAVSRARPADPAQYRRLYNLVEGLTIASGLPMPRIYIVDDVAPNAFATGRNPRHAAIAVTTGLLEKMNRVELEGVLAHELSHVKNYDILVSTIAVTLVGAVALLSDMAFRTMCWNGGRVARDGDREDHNNPLAIFGLLLRDAGPPGGVGHAGCDQPTARVPRRRLRRADDPLSARADLCAGEAAGRHHRHPLGLQGHCSPLDRAAHVRGGRPWPVRRLQPACSTPIPPSRSASPRSVSSEVPMMQNPFPRRAIGGGSGGGGRPGRLRWR